MNSGQAPVAFQAREIEWPACHPERLFCGVASEPLRSDPQLTFAAPGCAVADAPSSTLLV